jgi:transposase
MEIKISELWNLRALSAQLLKYQKPRNTAVKTNNAVKRKTKPDSQPLD